MYLDERIRKPRPKLAEILDTVNYLHPYKWLVS
jgi:hypothetical protein